MQMFSVFNVEYPFEEYVGYVSAETADEALAKAIKQFGEKYPHPVVEVMVGHEYH